jgi:hypothetical protein
MTKNVLKVFRNSITSLAKCLMSWGRLLKVLIAEKCTVFWNFVSWAVGGCELVVNVVWMLWVWLFVWNECLFVITYIDMEKIYWEDIGRVSSFLNSSLHGSPILEFVMILISLFFILKFLAHNVRTQSRPFSRFLETL